VRIFPAHTEDDDGGIRTLEETVKNIFEAATVDEVEQRLEKLQPNSERLWGKMDAAQMLAHCSAWMDMASGLDNPPRVMVGYIFGRMAKSTLLSEKPIRRNMPTAKSLIKDNKQDFAVERLRLQEEINRFAAGGPEKCTKHPHSFFGPMTPLEWAILGYKHIDHHLRQFGV
jgi:Protein of unknown function (DUF1569)